MCLYFSLGHVHIFIYIFFCVLVSVSLIYVFISVLSPMASFSYTELKASGLGSAHAGFF